MSTNKMKTIERLQEIMTSLMEILLTESLEKVESSLKEWRAGTLGVFDAHAELLKHAAKAERLAERAACIGLNNAGALLRDAYDAQLVTREEFVGFVGQEPESVEGSPPLSDEVIGGLGVHGKRGLVEELLSDGPILVHIDAQHPLVQVPEHFRDDPKLVLRFGYQLTPAIIDLSVDDDGMYGTLTFGGIPFRCVLPWTCIYSVVGEGGEKGMVWPEDVPEAMVEAISQLTQNGEGDGESGERGESLESQPTASPRARGGHLKLVK